MKNVELSETLKGIKSLFTFNTKKLSSASVTKASYRESFGIDCGGSDMCSDKISFLSFYSCFSARHAPPTAVKKAM